MIRLDGVTVGYRKRVVLTELSLEIAGGDFVALLGPNGCGKSTLLRTLLGFQVPSAGVVTLTGRDLRSMPARERARLVASVAQEETLEFDFTTEEVVRLGRTPYANAWSSPSPADRSAVEAAMRLTQVDGLRARLVTELSGGERRRVMLARALAQQPQVLLLDEPTANLDLRFQFEMMQLLSRLNTEQRLTVVVAIHQINLAAAVAKNVILFDGNGRIVAAGPPSAVITPEQIEGVFGTPVMVAAHPQTGRPQVILQYQTSTRSDDSQALDDTV